MEPDLTTNPYLQQEVYTVSPIRLRWMLVNRAEELCLLVGKLWEDDQHNESIQWLIRVREILCELLDGIVDRENPVSQSVSDFYIFLLRLMNEVEREHSSKQLKVLRELLAIEGETWRLACEKFENSEQSSDFGSSAACATSPSSGSQQSGTQQFGSKQSRSKQPLPLPPSATSGGVTQAFIDTPHLTSGGFSLEV